MALNLKARLIATHTHIHIEIKSHIICSIVYRMEQSTNTDEEIVLLIKKGDLELFGELVKRYEAKMKRYAHKFLFGRNDTDDLVQDVFIKAYVNLQSFDDERKFSPWIYRIAHNTYVNALKKKLTDKVFSIDFDTFLPHPKATETADGASEKEFTREILETHLNSLSPKYLEPMILYFYEDMDYKMISEILSIPVSTVGVRIKRGKEKLKEILSKSNFVYER
jgi:RNA polymerase sigma-70 factor (ECF subfamily)